MPRTSRVSWALAGVAFATMLAAQEGKPAPGIALKGRLVLKEGERPSEWRIVVAPRLPAELPSDAATITPNADGTFVVTCPEGTWAYVCPYAGGRLAAGSVVPVRAAPKEKQQELTLKPESPRARVAFALQREGGTPLAQRVKAHLYNLYGEVGGSTRGTWSDDSGLVSFDRLPCGKYDLWIDAPADAGDLPAALFRCLDVKPGEGTQTINLSVPRSGAVKGRLLRADGKTPAAKHIVAIQTGTAPDDGADAATWAAAYARGAQGCYAEAEVAADGSFALRGLTPGDHSLDIRRPGEREAWCTVSGVHVTAGQATDLGDVAVAWNGWQHMFDGKTLAGWKESEFWGRSEVRLENERVVLQRGNDMTGITWTKELPRVNYEVSLDAMRVAGDDFFCGLTFPVKDDYCSLILGGWGGSTVGLSSLDGYDASENETSQWIQFDQQRWYRVRVMVTEGKIEAWLDQEKIIEVATRGKEISTRIEVEPSKPFGISTWYTTGAERDIRLRWLDGPR